jgi:hypothetical protein
MRSPWERQSSPNLVDDDLSGLNWFPYLGDVKRVNIDFDGTRIDSALEACTFIDRLRGVKALEDDTALVLRLNSIHTIGLPGSIKVVAVDDDGLVSQVEEVAPNRFARFTDARFLIELPRGATAPHIGAKVLVSDA